MQLPDLDVWDEKGYRLVRPQLSGQPVSWTVPGDVELESPVDCWHCIHPLHALIGGLGDAGLGLLHFAERAPADLSAEPGTYGHLAAHVPPFFTLLARLDR